MWEYESDEDEGEDLGGDIKVEEFDEVVIGEEDVEKPALTEE